MASAEGCWHVAFVSDNQASITASATLDPQEGAQRDELLYLQVKVLGAAGKAARLMRCKSSAVNCLVRTASISDACEGNAAGSARMEKSRLPCGVIP